MTNDYNKNQCIILSKFKSHTMLSNWKIRRKYGSADKFGMQTCCVKAKKLQLDEKNDYKAKNFKVGTF